MESSPKTFLTSEYFQEHGYPYQQWAELRKNEPVARVDGARYQPFWAVTRHRDILEISRDPKLYLSRPANNLVRRDIEEMLFQRGRLLNTFRSFIKSGVIKRPRLLMMLVGAGMKVRKTLNPADAIPMLLNMDAPQHRNYRDATRRHFTPRSLEAWQARVDRVAKQTVARVAERLADPTLRDQPFDFVSEVSAPFPLHIIAELMGFPEEDRDQLFEWSNAVVGAEDDEYGDSSDMLGGAERAQLGLFEYFDRHLSDRRRRPGDDLVSMIAHSRVDGGAMSQLHALSYYFLLLVAGNETTRNALSGAMAAFFENPGEWKRLRNDPSLLDTAPDEMVRWTTPVIYFARTAAQDVKLGGQQIAAGDLLALYYPSANRDEAAFEDPDRFDVGRRPNRHLGFGIGEHVCLGAHLARMELRAVLREMLAQLPDMELAGPMARVRSDFVGGIKRLPVRFVR